MKEQDAYKSEIALIKQFMLIIKHVYAADDWCDMQTRTERAFEAMDNLLINKYKVDTNISLFSK